jgi:peptidyl-prolyl cis-trans isomerase SurA
MASKRGRAAGVLAARSRGGAVSKIAIALGVATVAFGATAGSARAATVNRIIATVDGQPITAHQLDTFIKSNGGTDSAGLSDTDRKRALDLLINDMVVQMESQDAGVTPTNDEVNAYIDQIKKRNNLSDERLAQALEAQGLTMEAYREQVRKELQRSALVSKQVRARVNVSPEEVERYYKEHPDEFSLAESVHVQHIFFPLRPDMTREDAEMVLTEAKKAHDRLQSGESFETVARDAGQGPAHGIGGDLGTMQKGQMIPQLEEVAFTLKEGQVSGPIQAQGGIHILRVTERSSANAAALEEVRDKIKEKLYSEALEQRYQRWIEEDLRKSHEIVIK